MMEIKENLNLSLFTTLRIGGPARYMVEVASVEELKESLNFADKQNLPIFVLGGGSNVLFSDTGFDGLVIRPLIKGREVSPQGIRVGAGEVLDEVIAWTVENGWWGMENLSFVPGLVGALAMQNVGCYGQEAAEVIESVEVFDLRGRTTKIFSNAECNFTYRHSRFNTTDKGKYVILYVNLKLGKNGTPNLKYKDVKNYFGEKIPTQAEIRKAIIEIRKSKGQDPNEYWSAGSFFSNFQLSPEEFEVVAKRIGQNFGERWEKDLRDLVQKVKAPSDNGMLKIPAGWIIDNLLGLKGYVYNERVRVSPFHALNLFNTGGATCADVMGLFEYVRNITYEKTGLTLVNEPEFVGF